MKTLDQLMREYCASCFVLADDGNGSSIGHKGRGINYINFLHTNFVRV